MTVPSGPLTLYYNPLQYEYDAMDMKTWAQRGEPPPLLQPELLIHTLEPRGLWRGERPIR